MDPRKLTELLQATIDPAQQKQAEEQLNQVRSLSLVKTCSITLSPKLETHVVSLISIFYPPVITFIAALKNFYSVTGFRMRAQISKSFMKGSRFFRSKNVAIALF